MLTFLSLLINIRNLKNRTIMKLNNKILSVMLLGATAFTGLSITSCVDEPDKYEIAGGTPSIDYVRLCDVTKKDSMLTGAYMGTSICLVGNNLRSITKMLFNDQQAILNTSMITDHTLIVDVPKTLTDNPTNKIYMYNKDGECTEYDFKTLVPEPVVTSLSNEFAKDGETVTLKGDYLLDYENAHLKITFPGNVDVTDFKSISKNAVTFVVPEGAQKGFVTVESMYGKGKSKFYFRDDRCILFDWDNDGDDAIATGHGWRDGIQNGNRIRNDVEGVQPLDGNYYYLGGKTVNFDSWAEDEYSFNYWPEPAAGYPELNSLMKWDDVDNMQVKFEVNIPNDWTGLSLQVYFTGNDQVTYSTGNNNYLADDKFPRALWTPWYGATNNTFSTSGNWQTVSIPLSEFAYDRYGNKLGGLKFENLTGMTMFLYTGPYKEATVECSPTICVDNIRVCPINE